VQSRDTLQVHVRSERRVGIDFDPAQFHTLMLRKSATTEPAQ
jgi:hypothetical protein